MTAEQSRRMIRAIYLLEQLQSAYQLDGGLGRHARTLRARMTANEKADVVELFAGCPWSEDIIHDFDPVLFDDVVANAYYRWQHGDPFDDHADVETYERSTDEEDSW